ncbi:SDR family oxidoreductase [Variovorax guangxiensis]|uniref:SDR family NAD(P)-dependent oxidoreductase n=1 Tax=Variovorax guangxiensis TaxID=1775474 RepID=UPI0028669728|nr:SDR family oxidoreductase [Variovorax guangxiensis]MDR6858666.1 NAD(P)-dependent dehydrogenase (short-subunit alcohol dehydrogenase family) [Variovorax guangxiensis]
MIEFNGSPLLDGQVAVVTGAGQGMGREIAIGLAAAGAKVVVADVNMQTTEETVALITQQGGTAWSVLWDVSDPDQAKQAAIRVHELAGDASILVNNAGIHRRGQFGEDGHLDTWREVMAVNLDGIMYGITAFLDQLKRTQGNIINLASIQSFTAAPNFTTAYAASKGGVAMLTKSLAVDLAQHGVRVNAIAPGFIETPQTAVSRANPDRVAFVMSHTPMKRAGRADEMAGPAVFLASHLASFVTGVILPVDGGFLTL